MKFNDWVGETENFSLRAERIREDIKSKMHTGKLQEIESVFHVWLESAWEAGYEAGQESRRLDGMER